MNILHPTYNSQDEFSAVFDRVKILLFKFSTYKSIIFIFFGYKAEFEELMEGGISGVERRHTHTGWERWRERKLGYIA